MSTRTRRSMKVAGSLLGLATLATAALWVRLHPAQAGPGPQVEGGAYTLEVVSIDVGGGALKDADNKDRGFAVVGQTVVGRMTSDKYTFDAGIVPCLFRFAGGDFDLDGNVDRDDLLFFIGCATGPRIGPPSDACKGADFDGDGDVDQNDFGFFQRCYSGQQTADPLCGM